MAKLSTFLLAFGALGAAYAGSMNVRDTVSTAAIDLGYAQYQGIFDTSRNLSYFLGMRYANPPTGEYRWEAPQAPSNVAGVQQATSFPPSCLQGNTGTADTDIFTNATSRKRQSNGASEDCLFLHVLTPGNVSAISGLPVVVWIHGGGYQGGAATEPTVDLIPDSHGSVVVVQIQYRLGAFGFLAGEQVKANGALNAGLLDQTFALQWVQQHVASFGGDPSKVTIWGESAGAGSVLQHVVANGGQTQPPLFRAAMTSSTFLPSQYNYNDPIPTALYDNFALAAGCGSVSDSLSCLRSVDASTLENLNLQMTASAFYGTFIFVPVVDGTFIVERPTVTLNNKKFNGEALLAVTNTNEGAIFMSVNASTSNTTEYIRQLFPELPAAQVDQASNQYTNLTSLYPTSYAQSTLIMTEAIFVCPSYYLLQAMGDKAYKGEFAIPPANHGDDTYYYFTSRGQPFNNAVFTQSFSQSFMNTVISESPNVKFDPTNQTPQWNAWTPGQAEMLFNMTTAGQPDIRGIPTDAGLLERCAFWNSVGQYTGQ